VLILVTLACFGFHAIWTAVLPVLVGLLLIKLVAVELKARLSSRSGEFPPAVERPSRPAILRAGLVVLLFTVTWYECATVTSQALHGLGERIEAKGGSDKLKAWASGAVAARKQGVTLAGGAGAVGMLGCPPGQGPLLVAFDLLARRATEEERRDALARPEIPDFVDDLLGPFQGVRSVQVDSGEHPCVNLYTGGSAYHFHIRVRVPREKGGPPRPLGPNEIPSALEWRPGIDLDTEGK
jgi:hypothetical protein